MSDSNIEDEPNHNIYIDTNGNQLYHISSFIWGGGEL